MRILEIGIVFRIKKFFLLLKITIFYIFLFQTEKENQFNLWQHECYVFKDYFKDCNGIPQSHLYQEQELKLRIVRFEIFLCWQRTLTSFISQIKKLITIGNLIEFSS